MGIVDELSDMFADTLRAQPVTVDHTGAESANGDALLMPAYIVGSTRNVRGADGQETVSSVHAIVGVTAALIDAWIALGWTGWIDEDWVSGDDAYPSILTTDGYRFVLPARFEPRGNEDGALGLKAIRIDRASDEDGAHHETVYFP